MPPDCREQGTLFVSSGLLGLEHFFNLGFFLFFFFLLPQEMFFGANGELISTGTGIITLPADSNVQGQLLSAGKSVPAGRYLCAASGDLEVNGGLNPCQVDMRMVKAHSYITLVVKVGYVL